MKLKDIVCDFEYAERLNKLEVIRKSIYKYELIPDHILMNARQYKISRRRGLLNTHTVAELGEMLPCDIMRGDSLYYFMSQQIDDWFECWYAEAIDKGFFITKHDQKEANARAKLLIWLIENKHVKVEDLNNA